jgi:hypothetical protein
MRNRHGGLVRLSLLVGGAVLLLSGCFKVDVKLALDSKALATGTYKIEVTKEIAALAGLTSAQMLEDALKQSGDSQMPAGSSISTEETDTGYVMTVSVVDTPLTDSSMKAEVLADGRIKFSFKQDGTASSSSSAAGLGAGSMNLEVSFPGKVVEASPEFSHVGDNSVSLAVTLEDSLDVFAISESGGSGSSSSSPVVPIIIGLAVLALIGYGIMRNRASASKAAQIAPTEPIAPTDPTSPNNWPQPGE